MMETVVSSPTKVVRIGPAQRFVIIGERINPTGRKLLGAEMAAGNFERVRAERFGPRTLDVDIVDYDGRVSGDPVLTLPHPRAHERAFVLAPWHDIDPGAELPGRGAVAGLLAGLDRDGVRLVPGAGLRVATP